jgi:hypothetical protein
MPAPKVMKTRRVREKTVLLTTPQMKKEKNGPLSTIIT